MTRPLQLMRPLQIICPRQKHLCQQTENRRPAQIISGPTQRTNRNSKMKTIITLTLAAVLTAGTFRAVAQTDDPLTALMKRRALEEQQLGGKPAATDAQTPTSTDATTTETPSATPQGPVELLSLI